MAINKQTASFAEAHNNSLGNKRRLKSSSCFVRGLFQNRSKRLIRTAFDEKKRRKKLIFDIYFAERHLVHGAIQVPRGLWFFSWFFRQKNGKRNVEGRKWQWKEKWKREKTRVVDMLQRFFYLLVHRSVENNRAVVSESRMLFAFGTDPFNEPITDGKTMLVDFLRRSLGKVNGNKSGKLRCHPAGHAVSSHSSREWC